ncbi:MAG: hypothetical protein A2269_05985 [Lentisphaerae bacterium RIFOXYA12_FULL_60_10]|nr:MAG: hypothetical protein A2269_05985 [Lentisphaerae bacterium RIFOXYA12_FULL_60_10]
MINSPRILKIARLMPESARTIVQTIILAISGGTASVVFMLGVHAVYLVTYKQLSTHSLAFFAGASLVLILTSSLIVGVLLGRISPQAAGSGIPQLKAAYWKGLGHVAWTPTIVKFIAGIVSIGGGASLGREGPSVYMAGGVASGLSGLFGIPKRKRRAAVAIGSAAGLAAAFNTPLAAITFVLEELIGDWNSRHLGRVVLASVVGAMVVYGFIGKTPSFILPSVEQASWTHMLAVPLVALVASLLGVIFQRATVYGRGRFRLHPMVPDWLRPTLGGLTTWLLGITGFAICGLTGVFGLGYEDLSTALEGGVDWRVAGLLALLKLFATIACYSTGGCGGIFSPTLFIGGFSGLFVSGMLGKVLPLGPDDQILLTVVGMSACLGGVIRAPLTSILIVFEMTHEFNLVPALMLGALVSQTISRLAGPHNFYDDLLVQDGHELIRIHPPADLSGWQNLPVSVVAVNRPVTVDSLEPDTIRKLLITYPYNAFPCIENNHPAGILRRDQLENFLKTGIRPEMNPALLCFPDESIRDASQRFINSPVGMLLIVERTSANLQSVLTLHDLLRAQASIQE